ncbi:hypothetical protein QTP70_000460 [Hemibagrus guttatus]|uniref:Reverse transcriptase domain-containing protein n=1 Tax=Hemibagrus guttatus TaxID=175788 RepID=A0AAE0QMF1_9TELE|nr:hypothetical protein QTP70_000460 [Hemibagrus guttatus]
MYTRGARETQIDYWLIRRRDLKLMTDSKGPATLAALFNRIVEQGKPLAAWTTSATVPIWKGKGNVAECSNYCPILLLCHAMKIFERILNRWLQDIVTIKPKQRRFVKGSGTTDAIHAIRLLLEKNKPLHMAFLDLDKVFDHVPHDFIWHSLRSHGGPEAYVDWVKLLYWNITSTIRCKVGTSPPFAITIGVHQGSALSPLLFILCMDTAKADLQSPRPWTLLFAEDVFDATECRGPLQSHVQWWKTHLDDYGMRLSLKKREYMECGPRFKKGHQVQVPGIGHQQ